MMHGAVIYRILQNGSFVGNIYLKHGIFLFAADWDAPETIPTVITGSESQIKVVLQDLKLTIVRVR